MKQNVLTLTITKVNELLFSGEAHSVTIPGSEGEMTILPHHEPLITILKAGTIVVKAEGEKKEFDIEKGMLETSNNQVTVLV